jgi:hypothetical protein
MESVSLLLPFIFIFGIFGFWIWSLVDIIKNDFKGNNKIIWLLVVLFLSLFGSVLYIAIGRSQKI